MILRTLTNINTARLLMSKLNFIFSFFPFFSFFFRFLLITSNTTPPPPYFVWNFGKDKKDIISFVWNNIVPAKRKKEVRQHNVNLYLNLSGGVQN